jgi:aspartate racemase
VQNLFKPIDAFVGLRKVGIVGGMGPLASAAFMQTLYADPSSLEKEQQMVQAILVSDPSVPDRTRALQLNQREEVISALSALLEGLEAFDISHSLICCYTAHAFLKDVDKHLTRKLVSLPAMALAAVQEAGGRYLILCTEGTGEFRILENETAWPQVQDSLDSLTPGDQAKVHEIIYQLKAGADPRELWQRVAGIASDYTVDGVLFACTDFHLLSAASTEKSPVPFIDPLHTAAAAMRAAWQQSREATASAQSTVKRKP